MLTQHFTITKINKLYASMTDHKQMLMAEEYSYRLIEHTKVKSRDDRLYLTIHLLKKRRETLFKLVQKDYESMMKLGDSFYKGLVKEDE